MCRRPFQVERQTRAAVADVDDAAGTETVTGDGAEHGAIVGVGIDAEIVRLGGAIVERGAGNAVRVAVGGYAMDGAVGAIGVPVALLDEAIRGFLTEDEDERADDRSAVCRRADVAVAVGDVCPYNIRVGVAFDSLRRVAVGGHEVARRIEE